MIGKQSDFLSIYKTFTKVCGNLHDLHGLMEIRQNCISQR